MTSNGPSSIFFKSNTTTSPLLCAQAIISSLACAKRQVRMDDFPFHTTLAVQPSPSTNNSPERVPAASNAPLGESDNETTREPTDKLKSGSLGRSAVVEFHRLIVLCWATDATTLAFKEHAVKQRCEGEGK